MDKKINPEFERVIIRFKDLEGRVKDNSNRMAEAWGKFIQGGKTDEDRNNLRKIKEEGDQLNNELKSLSDEAQRIAGIPDELIEAIEEEELRRLDGDFRIERKMLTE